MNYQILNSLFTKLPYEAKILWHKALQSEITEYELTKLYDLSEDKEAAAKLDYFIRELNDSAMYISNRSHIEKEVITKYKLSNLGVYWKTFDSYEEAKDFLGNLDDEVKTTIDEELGVLSPGTIVYTLDYKVEKNVVEFSYFKYHCSNKELCRELMYCIKNTKTGEVTEKSADYVTLDWKDWLEFKVYGDCT
jgi:hypothetical protein